MARKRAAFWAVSAVAIVGCESDDAPAVLPEPAYQLVFEDEFQSSVIDSGKWTVAAGDGCPALCAQPDQTKRYAAANVVTRDGALLVQAQRGLGGAVFSGAVHTLDKFSFRYGRVEVEARLPEATDALAAIRLLPVEATRYGPWPSSGEIALVESIADADGLAAVRSATRYGLPTPPFHGASGRYDLGQAAHMRMVEYALEWAPDELRFFLDGDHVHTQTADEWYTYYPANADGRYDHLGAYQVGAGGAPFDQPFYLAIDLAAQVGSEAALSRRLEVEAVRVYECANDDSGTGCGTRGTSATTLADNDGGPLQDAETAKPFIERLALYVDGPAAMTVPVGGVDVETAPLPESKADPWTTVSSDPQHPDPGDPDNIVWRVAVSGEANAEGQALLSLPNRSDDPMRESGFDFSGNRVAGPGADPIGEVVFDMYAEALAEAATVSVGLSDGYPTRRRALPSEQIALGAWKTYSVKFADLLSVADAEGSCCPLDLANVARPFALRVQGGSAVLLIDNIHVVNACKVVGGCGADTAEITSPGRACTSGERLRFGFYAFFAPVSYSADENPNSAGFAMHRGFEADLLSALEALDSAELAFSRHPITTWPNIWLRSVDEYDVVGGGITILDSRTLGADGETAVRFTRPHIAFEQSLLVRSEDAERLATHAMLDSDARIGVLPGTTGEARLLELTGLTDAEGNLAAGTRVETPAGTVVADGSSRFRITSAGTTENLRGRTRLSPPDDVKPQVIYLGQDLGERELLRALADGDIDAVARGTIGNSDAAVASNGRFTVTARDPNPEYGGWTLAADRDDLRLCLNDKIRWLTNDGRIGYPEWRADQAVFMRRAEIWNAD